jgi:hypothetical protein
MIIGDTVKTRVEQRRQNRAGRFQEKDFASFQVLRLKEGT